MEKKAKLKPLKSAKMYIQFQSPDIVQGTKLQGTKMLNYFKCKQAIKSSITYIHITEG